MRRFVFVFCLALFAGVAFLPFESIGQESEAQRRERLENELQQIERQILQQQVLLEDKQVERQSLERDLEIIDTQIRKAQLGIQARAVAIEQLNDQIGDKEVTLDILSERLNTQRQSLAELIRQTHAVDDYSLVEVMLSNQSFSEFFEDFESYRSVNESLKKSLNALEQIKRDTQVQKESLEEKMLAEAEMKQVQEQQKQEIEQKEEQKEEILEVTKGEEEAYQRMLEQNQKTAAELRNELFQLLGGGGGIPLPEAVRLAEYAQGKTGVPAALILAILEQETNIGSNLGSCAYNDIRDGRAVMHPDRDQPVFEAIAEILGFDARSRQVSCPLVSGGQRIGWGGAMGPSQFIPSTWAIYGGIVNTGSGWTYEQAQDAIRRINGGGGPANPFNNQDAFLATALLLRDNGANGSYGADRLAALRYYAGWGGASNPANAFYGDQVMQRKAKFESQIRVLGGG